MSDSKLIQISAEANKDDKMPLNDEQIQNLPQQSQNSEIAVGKRSLFDNISSDDFLGFSFNNQKYADQLHIAQLKKKKLSAMDVNEVTFVHKGFAYSYIECQLDFGFLGGTLGCAEGKKYVSAAEYCLQNKIPLILKAQSGGVRVQEGCVALMQMAVANGMTEKLRNAGILTVSIAQDPCFGGTSASVLYAVDIQLAEQHSRHGFAGPTVIANAIYNGNINELDKTAPQGFQQAEYFAQKGYVQKVLQKNDVDNYIQNLVTFFSQGKLVEQVINDQEDQNSSWRSQFSSLPESDTSDQLAQIEPFSYLKCRGNIRPLQLAALVFDELIELGSDNSIGSFMARLHGTPVLFICIKYNQNDDLAGLGTPMGYRTASKFVDLASRFDIPVVSFVDTAGALPTSEAEEQCQAQAVSQAISSLLCCKAPVLAVITGEGGSGGALALASGNNVAALEHTFYNVISPEGGASILLSGRKPTQDDCEALANAQKCYSHQLYDLGVIDKVISEGKSVQETAENVKRHLISQLHEFCSFSAQEVQESRLRRFLGIGCFTQFESLEAGLKAADGALNDEQKMQLTQSMPRRKQSETPEELKKLLKLVAEKTVNGIIANKHNWTIQDPLDLLKPLTDKMKPIDYNISLKHLLDTQGPESVKKALLQLKQPMITDTTSRDAHQSLFSTRFRTREIKAGLQLLENTQLPVSGFLFSAECWGGATFDTMLRFLRENPWERLAQVRNILPNTLTQLLVRGDNLLGYNAYGLETARKFVDAAQKTGMDVFRVFDAFNDLNGVQNVAQAVLDNGKAILQLCICYTGGVDDPEEKIYTLNYYREKALEIYQQWPNTHMIVVKDMSGLLTPIAAKQLVEAIKEVTNNEIPIGVHTHDVSGGQIATLLAAVDAGAAVIDLATASMAARGSQAPMQAFLSSIGISGNILDNLALYDQYWHCYANIYSEADPGASASPEISVQHENIALQAPPVANVSFAQIPGGQRSNLLAQCRAAGQESSFERLVELYAAVDKMLGHVIKVTPSSKVVGDLALYMLQNGLSTDDVLNKEKAINYSFPQSVKDFAKGALGIPHIGMNRQFIACVLQVDDDEVDRILENIKTNGKPIRHVDYNKVEEEVKALDKDGNLELNSISYVLFEDVFKSYVEFTNKYSNLIIQLPAIVFLHGMQCNQKIILNYMNINYEIELTRIKYPDQNSSRDVFFKVNGESVKIQVVPKQQEKALKQQINPKDVRQLGSDLTGTVGQILVKQNEEVKKGQTIMKICGAKLEVCVCAKTDGRIQLRAKPGDKVIPNTLVALVE